MAIPGTTKLIKAFVADIIRCTCLFTKQATRKALPTKIMMTKYYVGRVES